MTISPGREAIRRVFGLLVAMALLAGGLTVMLSLSFSSTADAAEPSPPPLLQRTEDVVTSDPLPTVQIDDGYVWAQATIGSTVYAVGDFDNARAPLAAPGTQLTPRSNILAYDINSGALLPFAPQVNGVIKAVAASPDGSRIYIGGSFTSVNGQTRWNMAAVDPSTGQLLSGFAPSVGGSGVYALVAHGSMVYAGGLFTQGNGVARQNAAAFSASNGALMPWAPQTDRQIDAMVADPGGEKIILGGRFSEVNGDPSMRGSAAIDYLTGAVDEQWALPQTVKNGRGSGSNAGKAGIFALAADDDAVYGTGWVYADLTTGNLEGTFAAEADTGDVRWIADCLGDHYGVYSTGETVYTTSHTHACSTMGLHPEQSPRNYRYVEAYTADARGLLGNNPHAGGTYQNWVGTPAPSAYVWYPDFYVGTTSGLGQAGLSITGVGDVISVAGEFIGVNNQRFEGIVRFSTNPPQGAKDGPRISGSNWQPTANSFVPGRVRVSVPGNWDRDDLDLTYELRRAGTSTPVDTVTVPSTWWEQPGVVLEDTTATPGSSASYTVVVRDGDGNSVTSQPVTTTVTSGAASDYVSAVLDDSPQVYYPLGDTMQDWAGANPPIAASGVTSGTPGIENSSTGYSEFSGSSTGRVVTSSRIAAPAEFSTELWFRTTSSRGGKLIGYGDSASGNSGSYDRHVYMSNSGELVFGVYPGSAQTIQSTAGYNDGEWHHVVASQSAVGTELYVDGGLVASNTAVTTAQSYSGYWRIGGDNLSGWPSGPSSSYFDGAIDEVAIYDRALDLNEVTTHYGIGMGFEAPTSSFIATTDDLAVAVDAATSSANGDITLEQYRWDFGDGSAESSGETSAHTYASAGAYTVTLTVVDSNGLSATSSQTVNVTGPNIGPSAEFSTSVAGLTVTADGSGSTDTDGQIVSYDWDWGDGQTSNGQIGSHAYAVAGFYTVTLTVTDDRGGAAQATEQVTATHADPTGHFTTSVSGLTVNVDAADSAATDGASLTYSWDWGDGTTVSQGETTSHTYADDGEYELTLTVTDSLGSTATVTQAVTVTAVVFAASDSFERTVASGWGSADVGGVWTSTGWNSAAMSVGDGVGSMVVAPAAGRDMLLAGMSLSDSASSMTYALDGGPSTGSMYFGMKSRYDAGGHAYRSLVWHRADGSLWLVIQRDDTVLAVLPTSMQWAAGNSFQLRTEVVGETNPTIRMKIWRAGTAEPVGWQLETTDTSAQALSTAGASSIYLYRSGSSSGQIPVRVDDYRLVDIAVPAVAPLRAAGAPVEEPAVIEEPAATTTREDANEADTATDADDDATEAQKGSTPKDDRIVEGGAAEAADTEPGTAADPDTEPVETESGVKPDSDAGSDQKAEAAPEDEVDPAPATDETEEAEPTPFDDKQVPKDAPLGEDSGPATSTLVEDGFDRRIEEGWGHASHGGSWALADDSEAILSVAEGTGRMELTAGASGSSLLETPATGTLITELALHIEEENEPGGTAVGVIVGQGDESTYSVVASSRPDGTMWLLINHGEDIVAEQQLGDMAYEPGATYTLAVSVNGDKESVFAAKLWEQGSEEPMDWQLIATADDLPTPRRDGLIGVTATRSDDVVVPATIHIEELSVLFQG